MANVFTNLVAPAGNGAGAAVDVSGFGGTKTITVQDAFRGSVIIEFSNEGAGGPWAQALVFDVPGEKTIQLAAMFMRVRRTGVPDIAPGLPSIGVGASDDGAQFADLPVPAGAGVGAPVNVATLGTLNTITCLGDFRGGAILVEISQDGSDWSQIMTFTKPGWQSKVFTAQFMRTRRLFGAYGTFGTANVDVGAANDGGSSGGSGDSLGLIYQPGGGQNGPVVFEDWNNLYTRLQQLRTDANGSGLYTIAFDNSFVDPVVVPVGTYDMLGVTWVPFLEPTASIASKVNVNLADGVVLQQLYTYDGPIVVTSLGTGLNSPVLLAANELFSIRNRAEVRAGASAPYFDGSALPNPSAVNIDMNTIAVFGDGTNDVISLPVAGTGLFLGMGVQARVVANALNVAVGASVLVTWRSTSADISGTQPALLGTFSQTDLVIDRWRIITTAVSIAASFGDAVGVTPPGGGANIALPLITAFSQGQPVAVKRLNAANVCTVTPQAGQTIDGAASITLEGLQGVILIPNGVSNWRVQAMFQGGTVGTGLFSQIQMTADGAVGTPVITRSTDLNTGVFFPGADLLAVAAGGVEALRFNASGQALHPDGVAGAPAISFTGAPTTLGLFRSGGSLWVAVAGSAAYSFSAANLNLNGAGSVGAPKLVLDGDANTGLWSPGADLLSIASGGVEAVRWNASGQSLHPLGTLALPSMTISGDPDTGVWSPGANLLAVAAGGVEPMRWNASGQTILPVGSAALPSLIFSPAPTTGFFANAGATAIQMAFGGSSLFIWTGANFNINFNGNAGTPALVFNGDADTGFFRPGANLIAVSASGIEGARWNSNGQTLHNDGSGALPSVSFSVDPDCGLWRPTTNTVAMITNATEVQRWGPATLSFFAAAAVAQQVSGANLTNNVTAGGTDNQIDDYTDLTVYANDAATIRNNIYQLARKLKQINDGLRSYGLFT